MPLNIQQGTDGGATCTDEYLMEKKIHAEANKASVQSQFAVSHECEENEAFSMKRTSIFIKMTMPPFQKLL